MITKKKLFHIYLTDKKIIKTKKIYLASGIFSTIKLINSINKNIFKKKIKLSHSNMQYGISFVNTNIFKKKIANELIYFDKNRNQFAGRIAILNEHIFKKYNLGISIYILMKLCKLINLRIFLISVLSKKSKGETFITFKDDKMNICAEKTQYNRSLLKNITKIFNESFKIKKIIFKNTLVGSDFHYSCDISKYMNIKTIRNFQKSLFVLDSALLKNQIFFPTFQMIYNSYHRVKNNISLQKLIKKLN
jgi:hypothetical protein